MQSVTRCIGRAHGARAVKNQFFPAFKKFNFMIKRGINFQFSNYSFALTQTKLLAKYLARPLSVAIFSLTGQYYYLLLEGPSSYALWFFWTQILGPAHSLLYPLLVKRPNRVEYRAPEFQIIKKLKKNR